MRYLFALAALGVAETCLAGAPLAGDFPALIATVRAERAAPSQARQEFEEGVVSWNGNHFLSARNHWVRARAWLGQTIPVDAPTRLAMEQLIEEADRLSQPEPDSDQSPVPSPTPSTHARARSRRTERKKIAASSARKVMEHARAAQRAGQTEKAARLMRIASTLPGGEGAATEADALEREAINGSGSGW